MSKANLSKKELLMIGGHGLSMNQSEILEESHQYSHTSMEDFKMLGKLGIVK